MRSYCLLKFYYNGTYTINFPFVPTSHYAWRERGIRHAEYPAYDQGSHIRYTHQIEPPLYPIKRVLATSLDLLGE
ncbi:MAG: hypothetical protein ACI8PB_002981 [Desulforhopalus sp.]|jgi:hypothetical protein